MEKEKIEKRLQELKTLRYLKKHDVNIRKTYSDVNTDLLIHECYHLLDCQGSTFQRLTDTEYKIAQSLFS